MTMRIATITRAAAILLISATCMLIASIIWSFSQLAEAYQASQQARLLAEQSRNQLPRWINT